MMTKLYETKMINTGGRNGETHSPDHSIEYKISAPGSKGEGTNPEQLFAAGYGSCFNGALELVLSQAKIKAASTIDCTVALYNDPNEGFELKVVLEGEISGFSTDETLEWMGKAHQVCPYSKATRGNINVELKAK